MTDQPRPDEPRNPAEAPEPSQDGPFEHPSLSREEEDALSGLSMFDIADAAEAAERKPAGAEEVMKVTILQIHGDDVFVDMGGKAEGVIPRTQFSADDPPTIGRVVEVVPDRYDPDSNLQVLSREGAARVAHWDSLKPGVIVEGRVTGMNKGGLEVDLKGIRGFMPASHCDVDRSLDISTLLNENIEAQVLEVDRRDKNVLLSRRKHQEAQRRVARDQLLDELQEGQIRRGVVRNVTDYGAFVDLGGVDGLLHVSDMSWSQVDKPRDVVSKDQEVDVKVLKIKKAEDGKLRISLGLKQAMPDPWSDVETRYPAGTPVKARVVRLADFGAFAEVEEGIEALIPVSEMSWGRINKPKDAVKVGDVVDASVLRVEPDRRRMALSMKEASPDPWEGVSEQFPPDSIVEGRVTKLADFGAFVELRPGVEGLIHISELAEEHVRRPSDVVSVGRDVKVKVLDVDMEQRRISLSIKALTVTPTEETASTAHEPSKPRKRKKPLRGGLGGDDESGMFSGLLGE